ncbi:MAG TPA: HD domain-containing protein [Ktedonobacterales bacterium]|nr:HD domain-containing protein [Ktedonobacterales bacterium]
MTMDGTNAAHMAHAGMTAQQRELLAEAEVFAREALAHDSSGHDWSHVERVRRVARTIAGAEGADGFICELAALLHDVADYKIAGDEATGLARVRGWLEARQCDPATLERVMEIIATMSFAGGGRPTIATLEGQIVQDADRLDAMGAVGVARAFAYGGAKGRAMYDPALAPREHMSVEEYRTQPAPTINHFYEKLLLLKDRLNTDYARQMAERRHQFMLAFLDQFYAEWDGRS